MQQAGAGANAGPPRSEHERDRAPQTILTATVKGRGSPPTHPRASHPNRLPRPPAASRWERAGVRARRHVSHAWKPTPSRAANQPESSIANRTRHLQLPRQPVHRTQVHKPRQQQQNDPAPRQPRPQQRERDEHRHPPDAQPRQVLVRPIPARFASGAGGLPIPSTIVDTRDRSLRDQSASLANTWIAHSATASDPNSAT